MPSRQRKQPENRRRTGCFQCKEKHVQCTEERPSCRRCERLGLQCVRGIKLLFREDAIERGIHFGREGTWSKRCKRIKKPPVLELDKDFTEVPLSQYVGKWIWLNTTYDDFSDEPDKWADERGEDEIISIYDDETQETVPLKPSEQQIYDLTLKYGPLGNLFSQYTRAEAYLLDYFISGIGPTCSLSSLNNPYMSLIPLLSHMTFRNAILTVSANQLRLLGNSNFSREACIYKQKALSGLKKDVESRQVNFGVVASVLMLCFHDISDGCSSSWLFHLRGGLDMTHLLPDHSAQMGSLKRFFNMYFVAHDIMSRTARVDCDAQWDEDAPQHKWLDNDDLDEIDTTMGCSRRLMSLLSKASSLARQKIKARDNPHLKLENEFIKECEGIGIALENLSQKLPAQSPTADNFILQIAEIKRLTALLYFMENLGDVLPSSSSSSSPPPPSHDHMSGAYHVHSTSTRSASPPSPSFKQPTKQRLVSDIIDLISTLPNPNTASVTWPLYIMGHSTGLEDELQRRFILERLRAIQDTRNLGNVRQTRVAVERAFRTTDLDLPPVSSPSLIVKRRNSRSQAKVISLA